MKRRHRRRLQRFLTDVVIHTPFVGMVLLLIGLWLAFAAGMYLAERGAGGSRIDSYGAALYWGVAAFSTAGIADTPVTGAARFIGGVWIVLGSVLFFGAIVATVTAYFMRPLQRPARQIVDTIEYNLERLGDLSVEELELLRETTDGLIEHMERLKAAQSERRGAGSSGGTRGEGR
jgi:voltage-gated potassium channel